MLLNKYAIGHFLGTDDKGKWLDEDASTTTGISTSSASSISQKHGLDIMVTRFTAHDPTVGASIARNCKEKQWKVLFSPDAPPIDIKLHVHSHKLNANVVSIESNGQAISDSAPSDLTDDLCCEWPLRENTICSVDEVDRGPCRLVTEASSRLPIVRQGSTGSLEVLSEHMSLASSPNTSQRFASYGLGASSLRLDVPKQDPSRAVLSLEGEAVSFGRPSPPPLYTDEDTPRIRLKLSRDCNTVAANVGHSILKHFVTGEVRAVTSKVGRLMHSWTVQLGPFANHSITVSKNYTFGKIITLIVDGEVFVESSSADLGFSGDGWECSFSFVGEKRLDFETFSAESGVGLDETFVREETRKYVHKCRVRVPKDFDFKKAKFVVDGIAFEELPPAPQQLLEAPVRMEAGAFEEMYDIRLPGKDQQAQKSDIQRLRSSFFKLFSPIVQRPSQSVVTI